jgi:Tol biopolymer transport system component
MPSWPAVAALALSVLAVAGVLWLIARPAPAAPVRRYGISFPETQAPVAGRRLAISPDGARLAYVGPDGAATLVFIKEAGRAEATPLNGTGGVGTFAFSPDGASLAFVQGGSLKRMSVQGGSALTLADSAGTNAGVGWGDNGAIVFVGPRNNDLRSVRDNGGNVDIVWQSDTGTVRLPAMLPGGNAVLFDRCSGSSCRFDHSLWVLDLRSHAASRVQPGAASGVYARTGHLIYVREDGGMFAVPFDAKKLRVTGPSIPVLDSVEVVNGTVPLFALSAEGTLVVRPGVSSSTRPEYQMVLVDRTGRQTVLDSGFTFHSVVSGGNAGWALSPDGRRLAIGISSDAGDDIWVKQLPHGPVSRLSFDSASEFRPRWSSDGRFVDYLGAHEANPALYRRLADGTGTEQLLVKMAKPIYEIVHTPDSQYLLIRTGGAQSVAGARDVWIMHLGVDSVPQPLLAAAAYDECSVALSPDGRWIAYESDESGHMQVYVRPFPNVEGGKWQVSLSGGAAPTWAHNGRELFYMDAERNMIAAPLTLLPAFNVGDRHVLFRLPDDIYQPFTEHYAAYEVTADGRFMMARRVTTPSESAPRPLVVAENWFTELRQKAGR